MIHTPSVLVVQVRQSLSDFAITDKGDFAT